MFASIEEGLKVYEVALKNFADAGEVSMDEFNLRCERLHGMSAALGLTREEVTALKKKLNAERG